jgi:hypothetical protein
MKPVVEYSRNSTRLQVRIDLPDGSSYGIDAPVTIEHKEIVKLIDEIVENPKSRRVLDETGGINLIKGSRNRKLRIYKERSSDRS